MSKHIRPLSVTLYPIAPFRNKYKSIQREEEEERMVAFSRLGLSLVWPRPCLRSVTSSCQVGCKKVVGGKSGSSMEEKQSGQCKCLLIETLYIYIYHHGNYKNAYLSAPITMRTVKTQKNCVWFIGRRMDWNEMGSVSAIKACPINDIWIEYLGGCWRVLCNKYNILNENFVWWGEW